MDDKFAVLDGYRHYLEWAAGLVVSEVQDSVIGVVTSGAGIRKTTSGLSITCRTRNLPILCFRAAWVNLKDTALSYHDT